MGKIGSPRVQSVDPIRPVTAAFAGNQSFNQGLPDVNKRVQAKIEESYKQKPTTSQPGRRQIKKENNYMSNTVAQATRKQLLGTNENIGSFLF